MKNKEVYLKNPDSFELVNNGVSKLAEMDGDAQQLKTLRFELENFVCSGEYARGLERILNAYLGGMNKLEQQAVWVSGFFGSGKSHLVKMLRYMWVDYKFPDGASASSLAHITPDIKAALIELSNRAKKYGELRAVGGTLGAGNTDDVRLAFLQLIFKAEGLPQSLAAAKFVLWLKQNSYLAPVIAHIKKNKKNPESELPHFAVSTVIAEALLNLDPKFNTISNTQQALRHQFVKESPTIDEVMQLIHQIFAVNDVMPCTLIVIDEIQQFIGGEVKRAMDVQELVERCSQKFNSRLLIVGTGQSALTGTPNLQRLQARFTVKVPLNDTDVENVIRQTVLAKNQTHTKDIEKVIQANQGEISRHLQNTRIAPTADDDKYYVPDYPLLPARRRFWERLLRNVDSTGTTAQLRTQLRIVYDAVKHTANMELGQVVPGDYIYDQIAVDLLNSGILLKEYHETIMRQREEKDGDLKSRLCALVFLIHKLPRQAGADDAVRATVETLADLLVQDLSKDGSTLRSKLPGLLGDLVKQGKLMLLEGNEYHLQTRESAAWNNDFSRNRTRILNDESHLSSEREECFRTSMESVFRGVRLQQGLSLEPRDIETSFSNTQPSQPADKVLFWIRHGWAEDRKTVLDDARRAGQSNPMLYVFLPRERHDEFKQAIATMLAAKDTIEHHGVPSTAEAIQAKNAIQTHYETAKQKVQECVSEILEKAEVLLGGGSNANGVQLIDKLKDAGNNAVIRMYPKFSDADNPGWANVHKKAKVGDNGALGAINYAGNPTDHPVCKQIYASIGSGKKGKEVRELFTTTPYGWQQDAIDAALTVLTLSGNLKAVSNGQPMKVADLDHTKISNIVFSVAVPALSTTQKVELRALFQKLDVKTNSGNESSSAGTFLERLRELADTSGGSAPRPETPDAAIIGELQSKSDNEQLLCIHQQKADIEKKIKDWKDLAHKISLRFPKWEKLNLLCNLAADLQDSKDVCTALGAIESGRSLLVDPDPIPPLMQKLVNAARHAINEVHTKLGTEHTEETSRLEKNEIWKKLSQPQRDQIFAANGLAAPTALKVSTEDEVIATLQSASLENRRTLIQALPQKFRSALEEASKLLEPKASTVKLPFATVRNAEELDKWIGDVKKTVNDKLKDGPVILG
ncbi:MAG: BREX system P-loop protein BrxC [Elusimicrobiota bacterium]